MTDFIYDKQKQTLTGHQTSWSCRSGIPGRYTPIANGTYTAPANALMAGTAGQGVPYDDKYSKAPYSYRDKNGLSWFLWIGAANLGIHPDGNIPGTKGCIGIVDSDSKPLFNLLKRLSGGPITIQVK